MVPVHCWWWKVCGVDLAGVNETIQKALVQSAAAMTCSGECDGNLRVELLPFFQKFCFEFALKPL